ncbi:MAG: hypothetical protein KAU50_11440 [Candidatus Marinimicrobia bacterium]|nr:hypothetical protein [Candidatus Neomarinimicrobiota bacterium]
MKIKDLQEIRDRLSKERLASGKEPGLYIDGVLDFYNEVSKRLDAPKEAI